MKTYRIILLIAFFILNANFEVFATTNAKPITYQGKLLDANNLPVTDDVTMTFSIYNSQSGGTKIWPTTGEVEKLVSVSKGLYSIKLGTGEGDDIPLSASVLSGTNAYLQVSIGGQVLSRTAINHVPYSIVSEQITAEGWANPGAIGSANPNTAKFTTTETGTLKVTTGAGNGKVLTSDANGIATWQTPSSGTVKLTTDVTDVLPLTNGGTGASSLEGAKSNLGISELENQVNQTNNSLMNLMNTVENNRFENLLKNSIQDDNINFLTTDVNNLKTSVNGLGTMSTQNSNNVNITGGTVGGSSFSPLSMDNVQIGSPYGYSNNTGNFSTLTTGDFQGSNVRAAHLYLGDNYNSNYGAGKLLTLRPSYNYQSGLEVVSDEYYYGYAPQTAYVENQFLSTTLTDIEFSTFFDPYGNNYYSAVSKIGSTNQKNFGLVNQYYNQYNDQFFEITFTADVETDDNSDAATFIIVKNDNEIIGSANLSTWDSTIFSTIDNSYNQMNKSCTVTILTNFNDYDQIKVVGVANGNLTVKKAHLSFRLLKTNN